MENKRFFNRKDSFLLSLVTAFALFLSDSNFDCFLGFYEPKKPDLLNRTDKES